MSILLLNNILILLNLKKNISKIILILVLTIQNIFKKYLNLLIYLLFKS